MKNKILFLLFWLPFTANIFAQSPAHGIWMEDITYTQWQKDDNGLIYREGIDSPPPPGVQLPQEWTVDGIVYIGFINPMYISNDLFSAGGFDGGMDWSILSYEENGNRVAYNLVSLEPENRTGTGAVTIVMVDDGTMYFESCDGDDNFVRTMNVIFEFGQEHPYHRVRVEK